MAVNRNPPHKRFFCAIFAPDSSISDLGVGSASISGSVRIGTGTVRHLTCFPHRPKAKGSTGFNPSLGEEL
jgi:hypothetical protein